VRQSIFKPQPFGAQRFDFLLGGLDAYLQRFALGEAAVALFGFQALLLLRLTAGSAPTTALLLGAQALGIIFQSPSNSTTLPSSTSHNSSAVARSRLRSCDTSTSAPS